MLGEPVIFNADAYGFLVILFVTIHSNNQARNFLQFTPRKKLWNVIFAVALFVEIYKPFIGRSITLITSVP
jgi:hypothetical protein